MNREELKEWIAENLYNKHKAKNARMKETWFAKNNLSYVLDLIKETTSYASPNSSIFQRVMLIRQGFLAIPTCSKVGCETPTKFVANKWVDYCSHKCANSVTMAKPEIKEKRKLTNLARYGFENPAQRPDVMKKVVESKQQYYDFIRIDIDVELARRMYFDEGKTLQEIGKSFSCDGMTIRNRLVSAGYDTFEKKKSFSSSHERIISDMLKQHNIEHSNGDRSKLKGQEIDIFIPKYNLGIEINGCWFHSEAFGYTTEDKFKMKHRAKKDKCNSLGINLLQFTDIQIEEKTDIVRSMILNKLRGSKKIFARKCSIKEVTKKEERKFLDNNHIQGFVGSGYCVGLYSNNELVHLISLGKPRFNKGYDFELLRIATKLGYVVIGGVSRLLKHIKEINKGKKLISYCDLSYSNGDVYKNNGFSLLRETTPNYFWYRKHFGLLSRYQTQKHKLNKLIDNFDPNLSESVNMKNNGFHRFWDCGNGVWELHL